MGQYNIGFSAFRVSVLLSVLSKLVRTKTKKRPAGIHLWPPRFIIILRKVSLDCYLYLTIFSLKRTPLFCLNSIWIPKNFRMWVNCLCMHPGFPIDRKYSCFFQAQEFMKVRCDIHPLPIWSYKISMILALITFFLKKNLPLSTPLTIQWTSSPNTLRSSTFNSSGNSLLILDCSSLGGRRSVD